MGLTGTDFETAWASRVESTYDDVPAFIIGKDALIQAEQAAGRPQDLIDVERLRQGWAATAPRRRRPRVAWGLRGGAGVLVDGARHLSAAIVCAALALATAGPRAAAQFDTFVWTALEVEPCAEVLPDALVLNACYRGCPYNGPFADMVVPATGTYTLDIDWRVDHIGGGQLSLTKHGGATTGYAFLFNPFDPWCRPAPCSGAFPDVAFYAVAGERLGFSIHQASGLFACLAFETGGAPDGFDQVHARFTNLRYDARQPPPELLPGHAVGTYAFAQETVTIDGRFFQAPLEVRIDGDPVDAWHDPTRVGVRTPLLAPGRHELVVVTEGGAAALDGGLAAWPLLDARRLGASERIELRLEAHDPGGSFVVLAGLAQLAEPMPVGPAVHHGLLVDPAAPSAVIASGDFGAADVVELLIDVPDLAAHAGHTIYFQALTTTGLDTPVVRFERSFSNLARIELR